MKFIEALLGGLLAPLPWLFALICFCLIVIWTTYELSELFAEPNIIKKIARLLRVTVSAFIGSYLGGIYIDGLGQFPSGISYKILFVLIFVLALIKMLFSSRKN